MFRATIVATTGTRRLRQQRTGLPSFAVAGYTELHSCGTISTSTLPKSISCVTWASTLLCKEEVDDVLALPELCFLGWADAAACVL